MNLRSHPYESYRASNSEWVDQTPSEWEEKRVKDLFRLVTDKAADDNDHELLSLYASIGVRPRKDLEARGNKASSTDGYWLVKKGDIVVNKLLAWMGSVGLSEYDGVTSPAYDVLRKTSKLIDVRYFSYLFRTDIAKQIFKRNSRGIMDMRLRLYFDKLGAITVPVPSFSTQQAIATYIDTKTAQIDRQVDLLSQKMKQYGRLKQSIINETIMRGLDQTVSMKSSGVSEIGEVPAHWEIKRGVDFLSLSSNQVSTHEMSGKEVFHYSIPVVQEVGTGRIENGSDIDSNKLRIDGEELLFSKLNPRKETICITTIPAIGRLAVASGEFLVLKPLKNRYALKYCYYLFCANYNKERICSTVKSVTKSHQRANPNDIHKLSFALPPIDEQNSIVSFLDKKTAQIDSIVATIISHIEKLKDLRKALINDVVTGKIKVVSEGQTA